MNKKIEEIGKIGNIIFSNEGKRYKGKDGNSYTVKSSLQIFKERSFSLGENLSVKGRILPRPKLKYAKNNITKPIKSGNTVNGAQICQKNFE